MSPGSLLLQPIASREPLAYCLLAVGRFAFWRALAEAEMRYGMEVRCFEEMEFWEAQARSLFAQGHTVSAARAHSVGILPVVDFVTLLEALSEIKTAATARADAFRKEGAAPQARR